MKRQSKCKYTNLRRRNWSLLEITSKTKRKVVAIPKFLDFPLILFIEKK